MCCGTVDCHCVCGYYLACVHCSTTCARIRQVCPAAMPDKRTGTVAARTVESASTSESTQVHPQIHPGFEAAPWRTC